jgi:hypothetical protein
MMPEMPNIGDLRAIPVAGIEHSQAVELKANSNSLSR